MLYPDYQYSTQSQNKKSFLTATLILSSCHSIHPRTHKISYPGAPSSYPEKLAKGEIEGKKSVRGKPIKRGKCQFLLDFIFPPLEEVSLSHFFSITSTWVLCDYLVSDTFNLDFRKARNSGILMT